MSVGTKLIQAAAGNAGGGPGEALYYPTSSGTDQTATWVVPDGVESVSVVVVGPGASGNDGLARGSGGGGALAMETTFRLHREKVYLFVQGQAQEETIGLVTLRILKVRVI